MAYGSDGYAVRPPMRSPKCERTLEFERNRLISPSMSDVPTAYLEVQIDGQICQVPLAGDRTFRIGRSDKSNVVLNEDLVSRNHAMLQRSDRGRFYITDCGSRNGTLVNGARITAPVILRQGKRPKSNRPPMLISRCRSSRCW